ncbi:adenylyl-sulfate kinase [Gammaproteobacteria bacterium]
MKGNAWDKVDIVRATNITWHEGHVGRTHREHLLNQHGATLWFTGLSGSGKSTVAFTLEHQLVARGNMAYVLDGDNVRHGLNKNLGFSAEDRAENIRRIGEVAKLFADTGIISITSFISPYRTDRAIARTMHEAEGLPFLEIYLSTSINICEQRDPKGLYKKARAGQLKNFTGIDDPYEIPEAAEIVLDSNLLTPPECARQIINELERRGIVPPK